MAYDAILDNDLK